MKTFERIFDWDDKELELAQEKIGYGIGYEKGLALHDFIKENVALQPSWTGFIKGFKDGYNDGMNRRETHN